MPIARFQLPDGRIARFEVPDGTTPEQAQAMIAQQFEPSPKADLNRDNTMLQNLGAGVGKGMTSIARALGASPEWLRSQGLPGTKEEAEQQDATLMQSKAGTVGNITGQAALAAPLAFVPGANTYAGAALLGGGTGAAFTEGDLADRAKGAAFGAVGGAAGKGIGDALGWLAPRVVDKLRGGRMAAQTANAQRDAAAQAAQQAGYVIPPADVRQTALNEALGGFSGKIKTAQEASARNQAVTNRLARREIGLADDVPLTAEALDEIRAQAGKAYGAVSELGPMNVTGKTLPAGVNVAEKNSPLLFGKTQEVEARELVRAWKQANHDATAYYRAYARDANPETLAKASANASAAKQIDALMMQHIEQSASTDKLIAKLASGKLSQEDFLKSVLEKSAGMDKGEATKEARRLIAKTYTVEKALNSATGDVAAPILAKELAKGKPLSGGLRIAAEAGQAFPKATQALKEAPKAVSPLDYMAALIGTGSGGPLGALAIGARPAVRSMMLSKTGQGLLARPSTYQAGLLEQSLPYLENEAFQRALPLTGGLLGLNLAQ